MIVRGISLVTRVRSHNLTRQIGGMMLLTGAAQGVYVAAGPFIGRLYSPEEMGYFGLFVTIWSVFALFACGLYDLAIPAVNNEKDAERLTGASISAGLAISLLGGFGLSIAISQNWFSLGIFPLWTGAIMSAGMLAQMSVLVGQAWAVRREKVIDIGKANFLMNILRGVLQICGGFLSPTWVMMAVCEILARLTQAQRLLRFSGGLPKFPVHWIGIASIFNKYRSYPLIFGPAYILDSIATILQMSMFGMLFGPQEMGQFFLIRRTLDLPVAFAFRSLSDLFFSQLLKMTAERPEALRPFVVQSSAVLAIMGMIGGVPVMIWGRELFELFYGPNWGEAGALAGFMVPALVANLVVAPVARIFQLSNKLHLRLLPGIVNVVGTVVVIYLAQQRNFDVQKTTIAISIVMAAHYFVYLAAGLFVSSHIIVIDKLQTEPTQ